MPLVKNVYVVVTAAGAGWSAYDGGVNDVTGRFERERGIPESRGGAGGAVAGGGVAGPHHPRCGAALLRERPPHHHGPRLWTDGVLVPVRHGATRAHRIPKTSHRRRRRRRLWRPLPLHRPEPIPQHRRRQLRFLFAAGEYILHTFLVHTVPFSADTPVRNRCEEIPLTKIKSTAYNTIHTT